MHDFQNYSPNDPDPFTAAHYDQTTGFVASIAVGRTRERWDWKSWNQLLDENVVLSVNFGAVGAVGAEVVAETDELPFMAYLRFNEAWKIEQMTLATVDLRPLNAALEENR